MVDDGRRGAGRVQERGQRDCQARQADDDARAHGVMTAKPTAKKTTIAGKKFLALC